MKTIAVLAVQGAFAEHEKILRKMGVQVVELRQAQDLRNPFDGLVFPGGESTVQGKLLRELQMFESLRNKLQEGIPVFATCAGAILLARELTNDKNRYFGTLDIAIERNGYGRQLSSFHYRGDFGEYRNVSMSFIRAPRIVSVGSNVEILSRCNGEVTAVRQGNQFAMTFHPELTEDLRCHDLFLKTLP